MSISWKHTTYYLILFLGIAGLAFCLTQNKPQSFNQTENRGIHHTDDSIRHEKTDSPATQPGTSQEEIPPYVIRVLNHILKYQEAPPNYVGGRVFQNRESNLKSLDAIGNKIQYREWDVHPKVKGKNRGAERLITGSDHSAYYTFDHYKTFVKIKQ